MRIVSAIRLSRFGTQRLLTFIRMCCCCLCLLHPFSREKSILLLQYSRRKSQRISALCFTMSLDLSFTVDPSFMPVLIASMKTALGAFTYVNIMFCICLPNVNEIPTVERCTKSQIFHIFCLCLE